MVDVVIRSGLLMNAYTTLVDVFTKYCLESRNLVFLTFDFASGYADMDLDVGAAADFDKDECGSQNFQ